jgi:hypothetical protein
MASKAEIIAEIVGVYNPDDPVNIEGLYGREIIMEVGKKNKETIDLKLWRSLLKSTLEDVLISVKYWRRKEEIHEAARLHGLKWQ